MSNVSTVLYSWQYTFKCTRQLSAREEVVAGVALGVIEQLGSGKATHGPEQEVAGVATEDPVVGPLVIVPVAVPARVGHGVEEVITGDPGSGTEGC